MSRLYREDKLPVSPTQAKPHQRYRRVGTQEIFVADEHGQLPATCDGRVAEYFPLGEMLINHLTRAHEGA